MTSRPSSDPSLSRLAAEALAAVIIGALAVLVLFAVGCCPRATVVPANDAALRLQPRPCLTTPPPVVVPREIVSTCPPAACLSDEDERAIGAELRARRAWDEKAWTLCGAR